MTEVQFFIKKLFVFFKSNGVQVSVIPLQPTVESLLGLHLGCKPPHFWIPQSPKIVSTHFIYQLCWSGPTYGLSAQFWSFQTFAASQWVINFKSSLGVRNPNIQTATTMGLLRRVYQLSKIDFCWEESSHPRLEALPQFYSRIW